MAVALDRDAVRRGIATYLAISVPCALVVVLVGNSDSAGSVAVLSLAALLIFFVAPLVSGAKAGRGQRSPFVHGALAVAIPGGAYLALFIVVRLAQARLSGVDAVTFLLYFVIEIGLGMFGGYLGFRRHTT